MTDTPGKQFPSLSEDTVVRAKAKLSTLVAIAGAACTALVCFASVVIFSYAMWSDVQFLKEKQRAAEAAAVEQARQTVVAFEKQAEALQAIKDSVKEIEWHQKYGATTAIPKPPATQP